MQRSILVMVALGGAACVALSLLMQHLVAAQRERSQCPYDAVVANRLGRRLVEPVEVHTERDASGLRIAVRGTVLAGLDREGLARTAGQEVWLAALRAGERPIDVVVEFGDEDGGAPTVVHVPVPGAKR